MDRRDFMKTSTLAVNELRAGLTMLNRSWEFNETADERNGQQLTLMIEASSFRGAEDYEMSAMNAGGVMRAGNERRYD